MLRQTQIASQMAFLSAGTAPEGQMRRELVRQLASFTLHCVPEGAVCKARCLSVDLYTPLVSLSPAPCLGYSDEGMCCLRRETAACLSIFLSLSIH